MRFWRVTFTSRVRPNDHSAQVLQSHEYFCPNLWARRLKPSYRTAWALLRMSRNINNFSFFSYKQKYFHRSMYANSMNVRSFIRVRCKVLKIWTPNLPICFTKNGTASLRKSARGVYNLIGEGGVTYSKCQIVPTLGLHRCVTRATAICISWKVSEVVQRSRENNK